MCNATSVLPRPSSPAGAHTAPPQPTSEAWAETVRGCTEADREWLTERQAIREFDGLQSRAEAEAGAVRDYWRWRDEMGG